MKINDILLEKVNYALQLADDALNTRYKTEDSFFVYHWVKSESFKQFETFSLSFIVSTYSNSHPYYESFKNSVNKTEVSSVEAGKGLLASIKTEIEKGWIKSIKELISAEIFTDFLEMAEHLLQEKYEHPAAVMIGSVLEEHLRNLCQKFSIQITEGKNGKHLSKKADLLNSELTRINVYNKLDQKNVTAWLDLRNKAAHGKYDEYNIQQVQLMHNGVSEFIARTS